VEEKDASRHYCYYYWAHLEAEAASILEACQGLEAAAVAASILLGAWEEVDQEVYRCWQIP